MAKLVAVIVFHDQVEHFHSERAKVVSDQPDTPTAANFAATAAMSVELDRPAPPSLEQPSQLISLHVLHGSAGSVRPILGGGLRYLHALLLLYKKAHGAGAQLQPCSQPMHVATEK